MNKKFYIGDMHIFHENVLTFDHRPFFNMQDMIDSMITYWQNTVRNDDEVYVLGDMFWKSTNAVDICRQLPGKKYLLHGNHDKVSPELARQFAGNYDTLYIKDGKHNVFLCHYPVAHWRNADYGAVHLYAHIHEGRDSRPFVEYVRMMRQRDLPYEAYNVGCMLPYMGYTPRTLDEIIVGGNAYYQQIWNDMKSKEV